MFEISKSILTFSEQIEDKTELTDIRKAIHDADQLVFLGFAFHDPNMELLQPARKRDTERVVATANGISEPDCDLISEQFEMLCLDPENIETVDMAGSFLAVPDMRSENFILDNEATCSSLFTTYRKTLLA